MSKTLSISFAVDKKCEEQWLSLVRSSFVPLVVKSGLSEGVSVFRVPSMEPEGDVSSYNIQIHFKDGESLCSFRKLHEKALNDIFSAIGHDVPSFRMELTKIMEAKCR